MLHIKPEEQEIYVYNSMNHTLDKLFRDFKSKRWEKGVEFGKVVKESVFYDEYKDLPLRYVRIFKSLAKLMDVNAYLNIDIHPVTNLHILHIKVVGFEYDVNRFIIFTKNLFGAESMFKESYSKCYKLWKRREINTDEKLTLPHATRAVAECIRIEINFMYKHILELLKKKRGLISNQRLLNKKRLIRKYVADHRIKNPKLTKRNYEKFKKHIREEI